MHIDASPCIDLHVRIAGRPVLLAIERRRGRLLWAIGDEWRLWWRGVAPRV